MKVDFCKLDLTNKSQLAKHWLSSMYQTDLELYGSESTVAIGQRYLNAILQGVFMKHRQGSELGLQSNVKRLYV